MRREKNATSDYVATAAKTIGGNFPAWVKGCNECRCGIRPKDWTLPPAPFPMWEVLIALLIRGNVTCCTCKAGRGLLQLLENARQRLANEPDADGRFALINLHLDDPGLYERTMRERKEKDGEAKD